MARILLTGAAGDIGTRLRKILKPVYPDLRLSDIKKPADLRPDEEFIAADLARIDEVEKAVDGIDGIIHLGGFSVEGPWETILQSNIIGCYNLFEAARRKGVKRVVFASSNHAVGFYPRHHHIGTDVTVRPDSRYGVSKAFGEALGSLYADKHGLRVLCLRIGNVGDKPLDKRRLSIWVKPEDLAQLIRIGLEHPELRFEIFYGASWNERAWWDNHKAYDYGYRPTGRAEDYLERRAWPSRPSSSPTRSAISSRAAPSAAWSSTATRAGCGRNERRGHEHPAAHPADAHARRCGRTTTAPARWRACASWARSCSTRGRSRSARPRSSPRARAARSSSPTGRRPARRPCSPRCPTSSPSCASPSTSATSTWRARRPTASSSRRRAAAGCRR